MEFGGGIPDGVNVADHDIEGIAPRADGLKLVGRVVGVGFDCGVGGQGNMSVEMVEAVCVLVGEPTLCCREDLFVISKVGIAEGAEGKSGGIEVGLSGFGVGGLSALISKETWSGSSSEVGLEVGLCWLDWKGLERDGGVGEDLLPSDTKFGEAEELQGLMPLRPVV